MTQHTGGIRRGPRLADNFTILSNAVLNDDRLSFRARGVLMWLLSKPGDWSVRADAIAAQSPREGREAIRTAMRELVELGYLVREKIQDERGRWYTVQTVYEEPVTSDDPSPDPGPRKSVSGDAASGELGALTSTDHQGLAQTTTASPQVSTSRADVAETMSSSEISHDDTPHTDERIAALEASTLDVGLPASYRRIGTAQRATILDLIDRHGIAELTQAAVRAHRPESPTMHVHGWLRLWQALPAPRRAITEHRDRCRDCEGTGFVLAEIDGDDVAVRCQCRTRQVAA